MRKLYKKGFSLLDIMLSLTVITIISMGVFKYVNNVNSSVKLKESADIITSLGNSLTPEKLPYYNGDIKKMVDDGLINKKYYKEGKFILPIGGEVTFKTYTPSIKSSADKEFEVAKNIKGLTISVPIPDDICYEWGALTQTAFKHIRTNGTTFPFKNEYKNYGGEFNIISRPSNMNCSLKDENSNAFHYTIVYHDEK